MQGIHLIGDCYGCPAQEESFCCAQALGLLCVRLATESGFTVLGERFHQFEPHRGDGRGAAADARTLSAVCCAATTSE